MWTLKSTKALKKKCPKPPPSTLVIKISESGRSINFNFF
jgi:hypothetical protein